MHICINSETKKVKRSFYFPVSLFIGIPALLFVFRFTAAVAFLIFVLVCIRFRMHPHHRALRVALALFVATILIPIDFYVPGFHGPLIYPRHNGPHLVQVLYGRGAQPQRGNEAILGGCGAGIHDPWWMLVWD